MHWAVVVVQMVDQLLPTPEDPGSNKAISNLERTFIYDSLY